MRKLPFFAALLGLSVFAVGCESPAAKKADAEKLEMKANEKEGEAAADAQKKTEEANAEANQEINKQEGQKAKAAQDALKAESEAAPK